MACFAESELDWRRIDVTAIITESGLAAIDEEHRPACLDWLRGHGYEIDTLDCGQGLQRLLGDFGRLLDWERQFGYTLESGNRNLDALRDGFDFTVPEDGGRVLELVRPDEAWQEDSRFLLGLLSIAQEHCRYQLALGRRFFTLLVVPQGSPLIGAKIEESVVPSPFWS